ncbi:MAG: YraN family protein [Planctomycetota bacterium]
MLTRLTDRLVDFADRFRPLRGTHRRRGRAGERVAARHLQSEGYRVVARNLRTRHGELDLVAVAPDGTAVAVEVKAGTPNPRFPPELHVTPAKQRKIVALAAAVARRHRLTGRRLRFDVIAVEFPPKVESPPESRKKSRSVPPPIVRHHRGAFESHV